MRDYYDLFIFFMFLFSSNFIMIDSIWDYVSPFLRDSHASLYFFFQLTLTFNLEFFQLIEILAVHYLTIKQGSRLGSSLIPISIIGLSNP